MTAKRKYEKCIISALPTDIDVGGLPGGADKSVEPLVMLDYASDVNNVHRVEVFKMCRAGVAQGTCDEFDLGVITDMSMRFYHGKFKSYPYKPAATVKYCFAGLDPEHPENLGATIESWLGEGEDAEQYIVTKPTVVLTPHNLAHGPFVIRKVDKPLAWIVVMDSPLLPLRPVMELPPGFNLDRMEEQSTKKGKYDKYFSEIDARAVAIPPSHKGKVTPIMFYDRYNNDEASMTIDCRMILGSGIGFGIGEPTGDSMYEFAIYPHAHPVYETYSFAGLETGPDDLGGTVEFWIGEGAEAEKYTITKPTTIMIPKNTVHLPAYVTEWHKPFMMITVTDTPIWGAKWVKNFPPGFKHAAK